MRWANGAAWRTAVRDVLMVVMVLLLCTSCAHGGDDVAASAAAASSSSSSSSAAAAASSPARESVFELEHHVGGKFSQRGKYVIKWSAEGDATVAPLDASKNVIGAEDLPSFKTMLSDNALYRIRVLTRSADGSTSKSASASLPACELQKSGFKEHLVLHLDHRDQVIGLGYTSPEMTISRPCDPSTVTSAVPLQTMVKIAEPDVAQTIPIQVFGPKPMIMQNINFDAKIDPTAVAVQQQQPFLYKYWYIIVPMMVYLLIGSLIDPAALKKGSK